MTNYDRIKNMTVEELADYLKIKDCPKPFKTGKIKCPTKGTCRECWIDYLNQEVEE